MPYQGGVGYTWDWDGEGVLIKAVGAAKVGIGACLALAVEHAKANHPEYPPPGEDEGRFANRTQQTIDAIGIIDEPQVEWTTYGNFDKPHVWGSWGIHDGPAFQDPDIWSGRWEGMTPRFKRPEEGGEQTDLEEGIVSRALFLEFGTIRMAARPFIYPAWDFAKELLLALTAVAYRGMAGGVAGHRP